MMHTLRLPKIDSCERVQIRGIVASSAWVLQRSLDLGSRGSGFAWTLGKALSQRSHHRDRSQEWSQEWMKRDAGVSS